ncbi:hypothetical protein [Blastococcus brunescens]|uniref:Uncharacterized protein n=1 Tax=Blastococcus brunescens TaxID=1564165 RepID=A0ABZ1B271_9ACTN|nr:hypothetical protein [Blastococcus sp. BMG 8361]WRL64844.1 hypothetical protein U6N30_03620 [Blastococcus sp. BMG 8361]
MSFRHRLAAAVVPPAEDDGGEPLSERRWRTTVVGMHVISAALWALAVVSVLSAEVVDVGERGPVLAVLGALALSYAFAGGPALNGGHRWRALVHLVVVVVSFGLIGGLAPGCCSCSSSPIRRCGSSSRGRGPECSGRCCSRSPARSAR